MSSPSSASVYMAPEYFLHQPISDKMDVYSFGVVVLEIISGKRVSCFDHDEEDFWLLDYAWRLWNEDKPLDLMDQTLHRTYNKNQVLKCITVGLLCVERDPSDRPTMASVVFMLESETVTLPTPKEPVGSHSFNKLETCSENESTVTIDEESP